MNFWLSHIRNLETFIAEPDRLLDIWSAGGADGLVLGPLLFGGTERLAHSRGLGVFREGGDPRPLFDPDPTIYSEFGVPAPDRVGGDDRELRTQLHAALQKVIDRGWELWLFDPFTGAAAPPGLNDNAGRIVSEAGRTALAARMLDTVAAFPEATGFIIDGPAWGFEISDIDVEGLRQRRRIFELPAAQADCSPLGYDLQALSDAQERLGTTLHSLTRDRVWLHAAGGAVGALELFGGAGFAEWGRFRTDALASFYQFMRDALESHAGRSVQLAACPRTPALARTAGYDYPRIADLVDVMMPKLYFWQRGYDGLVGTAWRWANTLTSWNPELTVRDACLVTRLFFGDAMPVVDSLIDFDRLLTAEYLTELTTLEAGRSVAAIGDRARVVPWVDTGRAPHDGDPMPAAQLDAILRASASTGIDEFTYFNSTNMSPAEWTVLSHHCGAEWNPLRSPDWYPADQPTL